MSQDYIIVLDVPGIKEYVFGTDRLVEIRGASALLANLNCEETEDHLRKSLDGKPVKKVFSNGGAGQFIIQADKEDIINALQALRGHFYRQTGGAIRLIFGISEYEDNYQSSLDRAFLSLKQEKEEAALFAPQNSHMGYIRECDSCSGMAAHVSKYADESRLLCDVCYAKETYGRDSDKGLWKRLNEYLKKRQGIEVERPRDFESIGRLCQAKPGYTALVYADGNAMGRLIKKIETEEQFSFFSETVDSAIHEACYNAILKNCLINNKKASADILLLGGDDLLVYLTADRAVPFAIDVAEYFNKKTTELMSNHHFFSKRLDGHGLNVSLGIVFGKSNTPFSMMLDQAEEMLISAKKKGADDCSATKTFSPTYIDYHCSPNFNQVQVEDCRNAHLVLHHYERAYLYDKPYSLEDMKVLYEYAVKLVNSEVPRSRLKRLGDAPAAGRLNATLECIKLVRRSKKEHQEIMVEALKHFSCYGDAIPWKQKVADGEFSYTTSLVDLIELTEFV